MMTVPAREFGVFKRVQRRIDPHIIGFAAYS